MSTEQGPELLTERTLTGIFVHLFGPIFGILLAGPVYYATDHAFTRENARHVLNWHLTLLAVLGGLLVWILAVEYGGIPDALAIVLFLPLFVAFFYMTLGTIFFAIIGTIKAVFGSPWKYPLAPEFIDK